MSIKKLWFKILKACFKHKKNKERKLEQKYIKKLLERKK